MDANTVAWGQIVLTSINEIASFLSLRVDRRWGNEGVIFVPKEGEELRANVVGARYGSVDTGGQLHFAREGHLVVDSAFTKSGWAAVMREGGVTPETTSKDS